MANYLCQDGQWIYSAACVIIVRLSITWVVWKKFPTHSLNSLRKPSISPRWLSTPSTGFFIRSEKTLYLGWHWTILCIELRLFPSLLWSLWHEVKLLSIWRSTLQNLDPQNLIELDDACWFTMTSCHSCPRPSVNPNQVYSIEFVWTAGERYIHTMHFFSKDKKIFWNQHYFLVYSKIS